MTAIPGVVSESEVYTIPELQRRLGLGRDAWRKLRRQGLPVHLVGRRHVVIGRELVTWLLSRGGEDVA